MKEAKTLKKSHGNVEDTNKSDYSEKEVLKILADDDELIKYHAVDETPFTIVNQGNKLYWIVMGKWRLSKTYNTPEQALEDAKKMTWDRIMQVIEIMIKSK